MRSYYILITFFLLMGLQTNGQQNDQSSHVTNGAQCPERFEQLKKLYIEMLDSEASLKYNILKQDFIKKANYDGTAGGGKATDGGSISLENLRGWVYENIGKTDYASYAEAEVDLEKISDAYKSIVRDNIGLYKYLMECKQLCGEDMVTKLYTELIVRYRDGFHI